MFVYLLGLIACVAFCVCYVVVFAVCLICFGVY